MVKKTQKSENEVFGPEIQSGWDCWYRELNNNSSGLTLRIDRLLESTTSEYQRIDVFENADFGKLLVLYGSLMVAEKDNNAYNEMLAHVPLFIHPNARDVLIIGGGDCGTLTEVLKHDSVKRCTMCELDEKVVEVAKQHFPALTVGLEDPRARLIFQNGKEYIRESRDKFDVILLDLSDPIGPAADLFQKTFHSQVFDRLADDGVLVAQSESPLFNKQIIRTMYANLRSIFPIVRMYTCFMPIYPSGLWSFAFCSKRHDPLKDLDLDRVARAGLDTRYYNAEIHRGAFALPQFCRDLVAE